MAKTENEAEQLAFKLAHVKRYREGLSAKTVAKEAKVSENTILRWHRSLELAEKRALSLRRRKGYIGGKTSTAAIKRKIADPDKHAGSHANLARRLAHIETFLEERVEGLFSRI